MARTGLLDLPSEIWSRVVKLAVEFYSPINVCTRPGTSILAMFGQKPEKFEPAITAVCRSVRTECLLHYYGANTFYYQARIGAFTRDGGGEGNMGPGGRCITSTSTSRISDGDHMDRARDIDRMKHWLMAIGRTKAEALGMMYYVNMSSAVSARECMKLSGDCMMWVRPMFREEYEEWKAVMPERWLGMEKWCVAKVEVLGFDD